MRKLWRGNQIFKGLGHRDPRLEDFDKLDVICIVGKSRNRFVQHIGLHVTGSMRTVTEFKCAVFILQRTSMLGQSHFPGGMISKTTEVGKQE